MLPANFYSDVVLNLKSQNSCVDICRFSLGVDVHYEGQCIHAPDFIRQGDTHKSFAVYHDNAFDFATSTSYDIFDLVMLAKNLSFPQAFQFIAGYPLSSILPQASHDKDIFRENIERLRSNIKEWHNTLLNTPKALEYLKHRSISRDTALRLSLGYNPNSDRLIIPFFKNGQPAYFAGRDLSGHSDKKYLYTPTDFGCSKIPFGLQSVKPKLKRKQVRPFSDVDNSDIKATLKSSTLILTEGLLDAVSLIQDGYSVLASGGGSFGRSNQRLVLDIAKMYDQVCLAYDNDKPGQEFQLKMSRWLLGEHIPFVCATVPHSFDGHAVKDINDYYCAGGDFFSLLSSAQNGIVFAGSKLNSLQEVYEFVKSLAGSASRWDLQALIEALASRTKGSLAGEPNPEIPETMDATPLFTKGQLRETFKAAGSRITDKEIMRRVLEKHQLIYSTDGKFYEYNRRYWEQRTKETVKRYVSHVIGEHATESRCGSVMALMKFELEDDTPFNAQHVVTFPNGVLLLDEPDPEKRFVPHNPDFRCTFMEDFNFNNSRKQVCEFDECQGKAYLHDTGDNDGQRWSESEWRKFLWSIFRVKGSRCPDARLIREAQKMCGYIYFTDNCLEKTFMLLGKGGNGKSTFMQIIEEVVGSEFCTHLRPNRLASSFDPIVLRNSILNICHEASKDLEGAEETLKAVTSGNPIMASYKGQDTISFKPRAKWIISANSPMDVKDVSYGFSRRLIFFPFDTKFEGKDADPHLLDKLRKEKPLIFNWMFDGYLMLKSGEPFIETPRQLEIKAQVQEYIDHTLTFVREYFVEGDYVECLETIPGSKGEPLPMKRLPNDRIMYQWYLKWCKATNTEPLSRYVAIGRINEAIGVKCPEMKIIRGTEEATGRERDIYVLPDFADKLEDIEIYDLATQDAIHEVYLKHYEAEKEKEKSHWTKPKTVQITPQGTGIASVNSPAVTERSSSHEETEITPSERRGQGCVTRDSEGQPSDKDIGLNGPEERASSGGEQIARSDE